MLKVRTYGDSVLRKKAVPVERVDDDLRALAAEMVETMHADNGIGLAAEQVGRRESICVVDVPPELDLDSGRQRVNPGIDMPLVLINPKITDSSEDTDVAEEGCLSFPDISLPVRRAKTVNVRYMDLAGENNEITVRGLLARCVQHELDHLDGTLIIDRVPKIKQVSISGRLKKLKKSNREELAV